MARQQRGSDAPARVAPSLAEAIRGLTPASVWDYENGYYWFADMRRIGKLLAHYELYKRITHLAGDVLEFGVFKGASLIRLATFRELLETAHSRRIVAFDAFGAFPRSDVAAASDRAFIEHFEGSSGTGLSVDEVSSILDRKHLSHNVELVQGDVRRTLPEFLDRHQELRIAMLHLDMDVYEPTKLALDTLWPRVVPGGIVIVDDFNTVEGATRVVDEFVAAHPGLTVEKLTCCHVPAFIVRPGASALSR